MYTHTCIHTLLCMRGCGWHEMYKQKLVSCHKCENEGISLGAACCLSWKLYAVGPQQQRQIA